MKLVVCSLVIGHTSRIHEPWKNNAHVSVAKRGQTTHHIVYIRLAQYLSDQHQGMFARTLIDKCEGFFSSRCSWHLGTFFFCSISSLHPALLCALEEMVDRALPDVALGDVGSGWYDFLAVLPSVRRRLQMKQSESATMRTR